MNRPKIEVVAPIYNEIEVLPTLLERLRLSLERLNLSWRIILVNDGSVDGSREWLVEQVKADPRVVLVDLSRNWGLSAAIHAGLDQTEADLVVIIDGDLQDPPELIPEMVEAWRNGADVVIAQRSDRKEKPIKRGLILGFHWLFRYLSDFPIPHNTGNFSLLTRPVVDALIALPERHRFFPGLRSWVGFRQTFVSYSRDDRKQGEAKQKLGRLFGLAFDAIFSFSYKPLRLMTAVGCVISITGFLLGLWFVVRRLLGLEIAETGFTTLITVALLLGGVQLISLGVVGEYVGRIYDEVKGRSIHIVEKVYLGSEKRND